MSHLLLATRNPHKTREARAILPQYIISDLTAYPQIPDVEETGATFLENATLKAVAGSLRFDGWVLSDDSGLEVDALDGAPGVHSARYAGEKSDDAANRRKLCAELAKLGDAERTARFRCVMALARNGEALQCFEGSVEGTIRLTERGNHGFGYDSLFIPAGYTLTFAQLSSEIKNQLSHRARALEKAAAWLQQKHLSIQA